jgi:two-component system chemotaxis sensor kinase CheA
MMASEFEAYRGLFVAESRENHENLVKNLLILEKGPDQNAIDEIFRSVHTLKGASASMGFAEMERLCHAMEDVFQLVRSGSAEVSEVKKHPPRKRLPKKPVRGIRKLPCQKMR